MSPPIAVRDRTSMIIGGRAVPAASGAWLTTYDPSTGEPLAEAPRGGPADVDAAVASAHAAYRAPEWARLTPPDRGRALARLGALLLANQDELGTLETLDSGKPLSQGRRDVALAARYFEYYAGICDKIEGAHLPLDAEHLAITTKEPYGVVGVIVPWNAPLNQAARAAAPALAVGNAVVLKPAEETPLTAVRLGELALEAGLPPGVLNVVTGLGSEAGQALVEHPLVRRISFTGSVETGRLVAKTAADRIVPVGLELGGKSANVVFPDADLDAVAASVLRTMTHNAGQICSAATRLVVHADAVDDVLDRVSAALAGVTVGPGLTDPMLGPLISRAQLDRVLGYLDLGGREGATAVTGGGRYTGGDLARGYFVQPTVFAGVRPDMRIANEEIFGPVVCVLPFRTEDEAVEIANGTGYGLAAGVYTRDIGRALGMSRRLEAGQVFVNEYQAGGVETPFGGYKRSGWGREKGLAAIDHYSQLKTTVIRL
ncbi:aldehyde dehydrogenase family protein [Actinomadura chibensis]|uniref:Aldehyde dehydrogenase family protein n=1 Tax=Actinomadura chibensis TaxID=392828 RepID=A0A5D0NDH0_9ACTN|nr:aldehyde dehydrogenase family protein [Actinomadura chibensis]TYB42446.1 aldehyde dehydrogenase family protein [Actinomadura chibensis]